MKETTSEEASGERKEGRQKEREEGKLTFEERNVPNSKNRGEGKGPDEHGLEPLRDDHLGIDLAVDLDIKKGSATTRQLKKER